MKRLALIHILVAYLTTAIVLVTVDLMWLVVVAKNLYRQGIGHLMADTPNLAAALVFYAAYIAGLMIFTVMPFAATPGWKRTARSAALFGLIAYATYDLTNLATLRDWPLWLSIIDMAWGTFVSATAAVAGKRVLDRMTRP